jgi:translation initiation factor IF-1
MAGEAEGLRGTVIEQLPQALYRVSLDSGHVITAHGTGDIRRNFVRILVGDRVVVRVSPFDVTRGRIIGRLEPGGRRQNGSDGSET